MHALPDPKQRTSQTNGIGHSHAMLLDFRVIEVDFECEPGIRTITARPRITAEPRWAIDYFPQRDHVRSAVRAQHGHRFAIQGPMESGN